MSIHGQEALVAMFLSAVAVFLWSLLLGRSVAHHRCRINQLVMYGVGVLASLGSFASAWGFAMTVNDLGGLPDLDPSFITFIASIGRGALLMGAMILIALGRTRRAEL